MIYIIAIRYNLEHVSLKEDNLSKSISDYSVKLINLPNLQEENFSNIIFLRKEQGLVEVLKKTIEDDMEGLEVK